jgi:glycosyltransferase involved in cell wall biosynthesis
LLDALRERAESAGIYDRINFAGAQAPSEVRRQMWNAHAMIQSSDYETFGLPVVEALMCGRPIISTACGGPNWIVSDSVGMLVPTGSVEALAAAMKAMRREAANYSPEVLRRYALSRYAKSAVMSQIEAVYRRVAIGTND